MKKRPILLPLLLLCLLSFGFSSGTLSRYIETMTGASLTLSVSGRKYEEKSITYHDTDAYTLSDDGTLTIHGYWYDTAAQKMVYDHRNCSRWLYKSEC